ncbi:hypothetical protein Sjap_011728 [Stephania japonica]|uniref:Uncharacterized protein n=1 Tax=Stephania japonica TaxID=461633 RepID=A0AAP0JBV9_9MAGN
MTRQSQNSTPSSSAHHSTPSSYAGGTSAGATHDSPSSSTHPSTSSSAPRQLPQVEMPQIQLLHLNLQERGMSLGFALLSRIKASGFSLYSLHPSDVCARKMTDTFKKCMIPERCQWKYIPQYQRDIYWERWRTYFDWDPRITAHIMAAYERKAKVRYKVLMNKLLTKGEHPIYVTEEAWRRYVKYWESYDFKVRSKIASSNRQTEKGGPGTGVSKHTGGSIPFLVHEERLSKELGRDCTPLELYFHVHTKKHDGQTFIDARSKRVNETKEAGGLPDTFGLPSLGQKQMNSMRGGHPEASSSHPPLPPPPPPPPPRPRPRPRPPPRPSHQETLTPPTVVPTPALDANDIYRPRMYEPEDEEETNLPLRQEWVDALSDTHPLPRPDKDN